MNFHPFPILKSARLTLRQIQESDSNEILYLRSDASINKYIDRPENSKTKTLDDAIKFINQIQGYIKDGKSISWGITLIGKDEVIGSICLWNFSKDKKTAEIGYDLSTHYHGKGIMSEAMISILDFGFTKLNLDKIEAYTHHANESSRKLLERNGFKLIEGKTDDHDPNNIVLQLLKP